MAEHYSHRHDYTPAGHRRKAPTPEANKKKNEVPSERNEALRRIFGQEVINSFDVPDNAKATDIFKGLLEHIFDSGTNRDVACDVQIGDETVHLSEKAAPIHSRSSLIANSLEQIQQGKHVGFGMVDLQNFRDADFNLGGMDKGVHSADIIINKTARRIRTALRDVWIELGLDYSQDSFELGRYGGDEFVIALFGDGAISTKGAIMENVRKKLEMETGYYKKKGNIVELPIQLHAFDAQGSVVEWLHPPESGPQREIYVDFIRRGTFFNETEFQRILTKYSPNGTLDMDLYHRDYPPGIGVVSYPAHVGNELTKKIAYIKKRHPELVVTFNLAEHLDTKMPIAGGHSRQEILLKTVEDSIFDRLLGDLIYSKTHFAEHVRRGEVSDLYIVDFKFLKEMNTGMTYADADREIKHLWVRIKDALPEDDREKIIISRFAGGFYIGVRKGQRLRGIQSLRQIRTATLTDPDGRAAYTVPIGYTRKKIHPYEYRQFYKAIDWAEGDSDRHFYEALVKDIVDSSLQDSSFSDRMGNADIEKTSGRKYQILSKEELYSLHLKGKRKEARITKIKKSINSAFDFMMRASVIGNSETGQKKQSYAESMLYAHRINKIRALLIADLERSLHTDNGMQ